MLASDVTFVSADTSGALVRPEQPRHVFSSDVTLGIAGSGDAQFVSSEQPKNALARLPQFAPTPQESTDLIRVLSPVLLK